MKTQEELKSIKEEAETMNMKLTELSEEKLAAVSGGFIPPSGNECSKPHWTQK